MKLFHYAVRKYTKLGGSGSVRANVEQFFSPPAVFGLKHISLHKACRIHTQCACKIKNKCLTRNSQALVMVYSVVVPIITLVTQAEQYFFLGLVPCAGIKVN